MNNIKRRLNVIPFKFSTFTHLLFIIKLKTVNQLNKYYDHFQRHLPDGLILDYVKLQQSSVGIIDHQKI